MAFAVIFQPRADRDIAKAERWIEQLGKVALERWRVRLLRAVEKLEYDPHIYPEADESEQLGIELRTALYGRRPHIYRILFTIDGQTVNVLRVRHAAQDRLEPGEV